MVVWISKKIEVALETTLDTNTSWKKLIDKYIRYPEKEMDMRMLVLRNLDKKEMMISPLEGSSIPTPP